MNVRRPTYDVEDALEQPPTTSWKDLCRRWLFATGAVVIVALPIGELHPGATQSLHVPLTAFTSKTAQPSVNLKAFAHEGELAFVSQNILWLLNGTDQQLREIHIATGLTPLSPTFSSDGRWLAFLTSTPGGSERLWMSTSAGVDVHEVTGIVVGDAFGWSPHGDLYAVAAGPSSTKAPFTSTTTVRIISPTGSTRILMSAQSVVGAAWSPTGTEIAVSTMNHHFTSTLASYPVSGGRPTTWIGPIDDENFIVPVGWWADQRITYTLIGNGAVPNGEGGFSAADFYVLSVPKAQPRLLGYTLPNGAAGIATGTSNGEIAFVDESGSGIPRILWNATKSVEVCTVKPATCTPISTPSNEVAEDPAWSASGSMLAYVTAPASNTAGTAGLVGGLSGWLAAHNLVLYNPSTGSSEEVTGASGAIVPEWSRSSTSLLYVANDDLWLIPGTGQSQIEIAGPLFTEGTITSYYGEVDWTQQFGWSKASYATLCYVVCHT